MVPFLFLTLAKYFLTPGHLNLLFLGLQPLAQSLFHKTGLFSSFQPSFKVSSEWPYHGAKPQAHLSVRVHHILQLCFPHGTHHQLRLFY